MEHVSKVNESALLPVDLPVHPYLLDHHFDGKVVLPAVEAMQVLAGAARRFRPDMDVSVITGARFDKFLYIDAAQNGISALVELKELENGDLVASLITKSTSGKLGITRSREHATLCFPASRPSLFEPPADLACSLEGICLEIPSDRLYQDLVPFGPSFQNLRGSTLVSREGAIAWAYAPRFAGVDETAILGSPFPFDASFHAACAWGQRYGGRVAFPSAIEKRMLLKPTLSGSTYICRVDPVRTEPDRLTFDIWIYDEGGVLCEAAFGVSMKDVSGGRMKPPAWVVDSSAGQSLERLGACCRGFSLVELKTVLPFADQALSIREKERFGKLGEPRRRSYLGARLACKRLFRKLRGNDLLTPASEITTISPDLIRPCCPLPGVSEVPVSVSHDDRFAVAVAGATRVGVDAEKVSDRPLKSPHLYMDESERLLVRGSALGDRETAIRIWTIKEAAAKAFALDLAQAWNRVRVTEVGLSESRFQIDGGEIRTAVHEEMEDHLFTLVWE